MTLNITLLTKPGIFQSADYRLSTFSEGRFRFEDGSPKMVTLTYQNWSGLLTYTGIGRLNGVETSNVVTRWLEGHDFRAPEEAADLIRRRATVWMLTAARLCRGVQPHTFVLAAHQQSGHAAYVVSNFQSVTRVPRMVPSSEFEVSRTRRLGVPIVTGAAPALPRKERLAILRLAKHANPEAIRKRLQQANAVAAKVNGPNSTISTECRVVSIGFRGGPDDSDQLGRDLVSNGQMPLPTVAHISHGMNWDREVGRVIARAGLRGTPQFHDLVSATWSPRPGR